MFDHGGSPLPRHFVGGADDGGIFALMRGFDAMVDTRQQETADDTRVPGNVD
jgi:hypothetical protein